MFPDLRHLQRHLLDKNTHGKPTLLPKLIEYLDMLQK